MKYIQFSDELDTVEGRKFIYKTVNFFVSRSIENVKDNIFKPLEEEQAKKYFEKYEFIYNRTNNINMELCHLLVTAASNYIEYIEDGLIWNLQFPFECSYLFDLEPWFKKIDIKNRSNDEILILLINKLYDSPYRDSILC